MERSNIERIKTTSMEWIEENKAHLSQISRDIWDFAELGLCEFKSSDLLVNELKANGFIVERGQARMPTAFVGTYSYGSGKPVIGFLAEYDALPGLHPEKEGQPGHGCGHNLYGVGGVTAATALKEAMTKHDINGTVKVFGTPSEENHSAKIFMVREHVFDGCDVILTSHPFPYNKGYDGATLAIHFMTFTFRGVSSHANTNPWKGRSALDGLQIFHVALEFLREHMMPEMRIHYVITAGGRAPNIVPDFAQSRLFVRGPTMADVEELRSRDGGIDDCARAGALASGTSVDIHCYAADYELVPNTTGAHLLCENMKAIGIPDYTAKEKAFIKGKGYDEMDATIYEPDGKSVGIPASTDTGDVSWQVPVVTLRTACLPKGASPHTLDATIFYGMPIGQKGMILAAKVLVATALDLIMFPEKLKAVTAEWKERIKNAAMPYHDMVAPDYWPAIPKENPPYFQGPPPA